MHPLDRLLHFTKRSGKYTPITSIDFMRIRAAATKECAGIEDPIFEGQPMTPDFRAHVTVYRLVQGQRSAFRATARWREYKPDQDFMWRKMPFTMLGKCAEALALRKGFPQELHGLYESSELDQAIGDTVNLQTGEVTEAAPAPISAPPKKTPAPLPITRAQQGRLFTIAKKNGWSAALIKDVLHAKFMIDSTKDITTRTYDDIIAFFRERTARDRSDGDAVLIGAAMKIRGEWFWVDRWMGSSAFLLPMEPRGLYREMLSQGFVRGAKLPNDEEAIRRAIAATLGGVGALLAVRPAVLAGEERRAHQRHASGDLRTRPWACPSGGPRGAEGQPNTLGSSQVISQMALLRHRQPSHQSPSQDPVPEKDHRRWRVGPVLPRTGAHEWV